jgi:hypothetical protein
MEVWNCLERWVPSKVPPLPIGTQAYITKRLGAHPTRRWASGSYSLEAPPVVSPLLTPHDPR